MIFVTGDTHGNWERFNSKNFIEQKDMTKDDYVIVCGDFGIWDNSKMENHNLDWLESKSFTTLFVDGNHSNFDLLNGMEVKKWKGGNVHYIRPHIIHLMRGQVYNIDGLKFFTFGGASSHDISDGILEADDVDINKKIKYLNYNNKFRYRVNHVSWWKEELPSKEEMEEGIKNLKENNNKVDFIITHSPSFCIIALFGYKQDILTNYLEDIRFKTKYKKWFCGHMHINKNINSQDILIYEQIIRIS